MQHFKMIPQKRKNSLLLEQDKYLQTRQTVFPCIALNTENNKLHLLRREIHAVVASLLLHQLIQRFIVQIPPLRFFIIQLRDKLTIVQIASDTAIFFLAAINEAKSAIFIGTIEYSIFSLTSSVLKHLRQR